MAQNLNGIPDNAEVWSVDGSKFVVYYTPQGNPPVPMVWEVEDSEREEALAGPDQGTLRVDRSLSGDQFRSTGAIRMGNSVEIANTTENPFDSFVSDLDKEMKVRPWLQDPEVLAVVTGAMLEGRSVTAAELKTTDWWQSHSEAERQWLTLTESDPESARQRLEDNRLRVRNLLIRSGAGSPSQELVTAMADRLTKGQWSETKLQEQIRKVADPHAPGAIDSEIAALVQEERDITRKGEDVVRETVHKWLGEHFGNWEESDIQRWAGKYRNDPDALQDLEEHLKQQKNALFPDYNENASWQDIATPWKNFVRQQWGQNVSDDSHVLYRVMRMNDAEQAADYLREQGIKRGVGTVVDKMIEDATRAFGGNVVETI